MNQIFGVGCKKLLYAITTRNHTVYIHGNKGYQALNTPTLQYIAWISWYSSEIADYYPCSEKLFILQYYTCTNLYRIYITEICTSLGTIVVTSL